MGNIAKTILFFCFVLVLIVLLFLTIFFLSFKTDYKNFVFESATQNDVSSSLVFAVIKAESKFNKNAKSTANAIGLMQVKLSTANYMLALENKSPISETELFDPQTNIELGTKYLKYLSKKFDDIQVVICAYNAGETVVNDWLKNSDYSKDGKSLDKIPYQETENYLQKVLFNQKIYKKIFKFD